MLSGVRHALPFGKHLRVTWSDPEVHREVTLNIQDALALLANLGPEGFEGFMGFFVFTSLC